jgi:hypothetical protein
MSILDNVWPSIGIALLLAVLLTVMAGRFIKEDRNRLVVVALLLLMGMFIPLNGLTSAQWLRSVVGDLSVLSWVVFFGILSRRLFSYDFIKPNAQQSLLLGIVLVGVVFYPLALGISRFDPYQLGYQSLIIPVLLCILSIAAWLAAQRILAIILLLPLLAFNLYLFESNNLWDYLMDPVLFVYALVQVIRTHVWSRFVSVKV